MATSIRPRPAAVDAEVLARAVHDLRAPLTVIRGLCEVLARGDESPRTANGLRAIEGEVERLVDGLDALLHAPSTGRRPIDVTALAAEAVRRFRWAARERGVRVALRGAPGALVVGDAPALARALDNLLGNALRHCARGGGVWVSVRVRGHHARLRVRDDGPGVPAADRERIFLPGERGSAPRGPGRGLGLAIARDIALAHGGTLDLAPCASGAAFCLVLPLAGTEADPCAAA